jgi:REP element-mobilizing transposase RayT
MDESESLSHSKWEYKYHLIFIPKYRRKMLHEQLRLHLGEVFKRLAKYKDSRVEEGHLMPDHVHVLISIPPKHAVPSSWIHQGQERDSFDAGVWRAQTQLCRAAFLGERLFRVNGRTR